jgi:hypothetical protein
LRRRVVGAAVALVVLVAVWLGWSHHVAPAKSDDVGSDSTSTGSRLAGPVADAAVMPRHKGGLRIEGQVIDDRDQPVEGALVKTWRDDPMDSNRTQYAEDVTTAADGTFALDDLEASYYYVAATKAEMFASVEGLTLTPSSEPVVLRLRDGVSAVVRVVDADTRTPIAGVEVHVSAWDSFDDLSTGLRVGVSDVSGVVRLHGLGAGWNLRAKSASPMFELTEASVQLGTSPSSVNELVLAVSKGARVSGTVHDPNGHPVADAVVYAESSHTEQFVNTDAEGRWHFDALARGPHLFSAWKGRSGRTTSQLDLDGHPRDHIDLVLTAGRLREPLVGIVVDETGKPVAKATVVVHAGAEPDSDYSETDATGHFQAEVAPGDARIFAAKDDRASLELAIASAVRREPIRLEMKPSVIEGVVVDHRGTPVVGATVFGTYGFTRPTSDARGHFTVGGEIPGPHKLAAARSEDVDFDALEWVDVNTGDHDVKLVVPETFAITGQLVLDGANVPAFGVSVLKDPSETHRLHGETRRTTDGRFTVPGLPPGTWNVSLGGSGFEPVIEHVHIEHHDVDLGIINVKAGQRIRGHVVDQHGASIVGARVSVRTGEDWFGGSVMKRAMDGLPTTTTDGSGDYELVGIKARDRTWIVATHPSFGSSIPYKIDAATSRADLTIAQTGSLEGTVDDTLDDYSFVMLTRVGDRDYHLAPRVDRVQHFIADDLPAGEYVAALGDSPGLPVHVTIVAGQRTHLDLVVPKSKIEIAVHATKPCKRLELLTGDSSRDVVRSDACSDATWSAVPGTYQLCADASCTSITVEQTPPNQTFQLP